MALKRTVCVSLVCVAAIWLMACGRAVDKPNLTSVISSGAWTSTDKSTDQGSWSDNLPSAAGMALPPIAGVVTEAHTPDSGPSISFITVQTSEPVQKYAKFEISFEITSTTATNMFFPYDDNAPPGIESGTGITVDALFLPLGETDWHHARVLPCFFYQPVEETGSGENAALLPTGPPEWRCRFTPDAAGAWRYKLRATDAGGTTETGASEFTALHSHRQGFIKVSASDPRFFEFSDGTPFMTPLVNVEQGNPFNTLAQIRENVRALGQGGVRFVRWFPTGEGANYFVVPFGDTMRINWRFGNGWTTPDDADTASGKKFSFAPYYYSSQPIPISPASRYRLSLRAKVTGERVLRAQIGNLSGGTIDICSITSTYHESNGTGDACTYLRDGWHDYSIEVTTGDATTLSVALRGLYTSSDAPSPYDTELDGRIRIHSISFQRDETGHGNWGPNLLTRSDPDTYKYVDQRSAARLDEIFRLSDQYGVYHKLTLFHKNDAILNRFQPDGSVGEWDQDSKNFYSAEGLASRWYQQAYVRYFIARWSYSPALHSLELANENHLTEESYDAAFSLAEYVHSISPRPILMSNSFWGWFVSGFWTDPERSQSMDYADKHWYANESGSSCAEGVCELISNTWTDSAAYVRECRNRFQDYREWYDYQKPIVRGEGGVAESGTGPQHPDIATDAQGTYYHKKVWAHVGLLGSSCDGEWYPRLFVLHEEDQFPNSRRDLFDLSSAFERFMQGETLNSGNYLEIGTDITGTQHITLTNLTGNLRAWGVRDANSGRVLLWIDNADHTWKNMVDGASIAPASATLALQGLPPGGYTAEWWDTRSGQVIRTETYVVQDTGVLILSIDDLGNDLAVKFIRQGSNTPPTANDDNVIITENVAVHIDVLANDSDVDGDNIRIDSFDPTSTNGGKVTLDDGDTPQDPTDDELVYTPPADSLSTGSFMYVITDGYEGYATAIVTITPAMEIYLPVILKSPLQPSS